MTVDAGVGHRLSDNELETLPTTTEPEGDPSPTAIRFESVHSPDWQLETE